MPATRTNKPSTSQKGPKGRPAVQPETVPGVQKLKASLRQTRRLLAKVSLDSLYASKLILSQDNLAANVRVGTERRLKSLQADLEHAETANKERAVAIRYHKVKFFGEFCTPPSQLSTYKQPLERQKVLRKIQQTKRELEKSPAKPDLESRLLELRVDLNYILV